MTDFPKDFKKSSSDKVKCVKFFSIPHPETSDIIQARTRVEKRWNTILKKHVPKVKFDLTGTKFFNNTLFDWATTGDDEVTYRIYSNGENSRSIQYVLQIMK